MKYVVKYILVTMVGILLTACVSGTSSNLVNATLTQSAYEGTVGQTTSVPVTFTTNTGTATNLSVNLSSLPSGWSQQNSQATFTCSSVTSSGTGCQLNLAYTPTAVTASTTLSLSYNYTASDGTAKSGTVNITYSAISASAPSDLYVTTTFGGTTGVYQCPLASNGSFSSCNPLTDSAFGGSDGINFFTPTNGTTYAYVANFSNNDVSQCAVQPDGSFATCTSAGSVNSPSGIVFEAMNGTTYAYVPSNTGNNVSICTLKANGAFNTCTLATGFDTPIAIAFQTMGSNTYAYVTNNNTFGSTYSISRCDVGSDGSLSACAQLAIPGVTLNQPTGVGFQTIGSTTYAYVIANSNSTTIEQCQVSPVNGSFGSCNATGNLPGLQTAGISFATAGNGNTYAYLSDLTNETITQCAVNNTTGVLTGCTNLGSTIFGGRGPTAIAFH